MDISCLVWKLCTTYAVPVVTRCFTTRHHESPVATIMPRWQSLAPSPPAIVHVYEDCIVSFSVVYGKLKGRRGLNCEGRRAKSRVAEAESGNQLGPGIQPNNQPQSPCLFSLSLTSEDRHPPFDLSTHIMTNPPTLQMCAIGVDPTGRPFLATDLPPRRP